MAITVCLECADFLHRLVERKTAEVDPIKTHALLANLNI
jgi:hypothetical protein